MPRTDLILHRLRWPSLVLACLLMMAVVWWVLPVHLLGAAGLVGVVGFLPVNFVGGVIHYLLAINYIAILLLTLRYMFPAGSPLPLATRMTRSQPPSRPMVLTVALMISALATGLILTLLEAQDFWANIIYSTEFTTEDTHLFRAGPGMAIALICWAAGIALLNRFWRKGDAMNQIMLASHRLAIAAMFLLIIAAVVHNHAMERDPTLIHQGFGSYTGLVLGVSVLAWSLLVAAIRHCFLARYHQALLVSHDWQESPRPRGHMSITFRLIYMSRQLAFAVVAVIMTVVLWLMFTDIFIRVPLGSLTLRHLSIATNGYWLVPDHGIRGIMGIYPATRVAHLGLSLVGLTLFLLSQYLFERPLRGSLQSLTRQGRLSWANAAGIAIPAAGLTVGGAALIFEHMGLWSQFIPHAGPVSGRRHYGVIIEPAFWLAMPLLAGSFLIWTTGLRVMKLPSTLFVKRAQILFMIFIAATAELFIAGMIQSISHGYGGQFWNHGTFTTLCVGASVTLWTCIPALRLIYAGQDYAALVNPISPPAPAGMAAPSMSPDLMSGNIAIDD